MSEEKLFSGADEEALWLDVSRDLASAPALLEYHAILQQAHRRVLLDIENDPGGGFESGYAYTSFTSYLFSRDAFRFAIHQQSFVDEVGKFFGMEDASLGYADFDRVFIVKTNDPEKCTLLFQDEQTRAVLQELPSCSFGIVHYALEQGDEAPFLELRIAESITDPQNLRYIYHAFCLVLDRLT